MIARDLRAPSEAGKHAYWLCRCECGTERSVNSNMLRSGRSQSCGCLQREGVAARNTKHGQFGTKVYDAWCSMWKRCTNPGHRHYRHYGGRGIKVCERWKRFEEFYEDMGEPPSPEHSIDRYPDNDGHYEPDNVRWAEPEEQQSNRRNNKLLEHQGQTASVAEWSRRTGIPAHRISRRLKRGWTTEEALAGP